MGIFKNRQFNLIYVHYALQAFTHYGGEAFAFIYLLKAGIPVPIVLLSIGAVFGIRVVFRQLVLPLAKRFGLKQTLIGAIVLEALTYPLLSQVTGVQPLLFVYLLWLAVSSSFYWTTYHAYVALMGNSEHSGAQTSGLMFVSMCIGIVAPVLSSLLLTYFNPLVTFSIVGLAMLASAIPIYFAPNFKIAEKADMPLATKKLAWRIMFADGLRAGFFHFTWLIALFITLGSSYVAFGGTLALAGMVGAVMGLYLGKYIDLGNGQNALKWGFSALAFAVLARAFGYPEVWTAILANAVAAITWPIYETASASRMYNLARQSSCPLRYHVVAEGGWDTGTAVGCSVAAAFVYFGFGFFWPLLLGLVGCGFGYYFANSSYRTNPEF